MEQRHREKRQRDLIKKNRLKDYYRSVDKINAISIKEFEKEMQKYEKISIDDINGYIQSFKDTPEFIHLNKTILAACIAHIININKKWDTLVPEDFQVPGNEENSISMDVIQNVNKTLKFDIDEYNIEEVCSSIYRYSEWIKNNL